MLKTQLNQTHNFWERTQSDSQLMNAHEKMGKSPQKIFQKWGEKRVEKVMGRCVGICDSCLVCCEACKCALGSFLAFPSWEMASEVEAP